MRISENQGECPYCSYNNTITPVRCFGNHSSVLSPSGLVGFHVDVACAKCSKPFRERYMVRSESSSKDPNNSVYIGTREIL